MTDVNREKYAHLMGEIEEFEENIEKLQAASADKEKIISLQEELSEKRNELARMSDGCGTPHTQS